jgi:hypothetical protein
MTLKWVTVPGSGIAYDGDKSVQGAIDEVSRTLGYTVSSKNYLPNNASSQTVGGVVFTVNTDKSVIGNGKGLTNPWDTLYLLGNNAKNDYRKIIGLKNGVEYIFTCCPSGASTDTFQGHLYVVDENNNVTVLRDNGEGVTFTHNDNYKYCVGISVKYNYTLSNVTFYPMISLEGGEYEPYVEDVQTQIDTLEEFGYWTPNATTFTADRCYYIKTKKMLTVWFCFYPSKNVTSEEHYTVCLDIKKTFGINNFKYGFNTCYNSNNKLGFVTLEAMSNVLKVNKLADDLFMSYAIYGQVSCYIE